MSKSNLASTDYKEYSDSSKSNLSTCSESRVSPKKIKLMANRIFKKYELFLIYKNMYPNIYSCCTTGNNTEAQTVVRITILSTLSH